MFHCLEVASTQMSKLSYTWLNGKQHTQLTYSSVQSDMRLGTLGKCILILIFRKDQ